MNRLFGREWFRLRLAIFHAQPRQQFYDRRPPMSYAAEFLQPILPELAVVRLSSRNERAFVVKLRQARQALPLIELMPITDRVVVHIQDLRRFLPTPNHCPARSGYPD
jgi:hypothetical protein